jgi:hypothetical protein
MDALKGAAMIRNLSISLCAEFNFYTDGRVFCLDTKRKPL